MTTTIAPITKKKIADLISNREGAKFSKIEMETFQRFILVSSKLRAAEVDGKLVCLWGLIPPTMIADQAYIWFHTTEAAQEHEFLVVRHSQIQVKEMLKEFPRLVGHCELGAERSIRWLKWLGAVFGEHDGRMVAFEIVRKE